ncbi:Pkinase-domain-containing protein [Mycena vulgaris]|nr:Pkinase-domain-containing protein [Mycena vulgaris]KAJ6570503.1 Pkinase-domain-containing protein [Mycena vulgaris]
MVASKPMTATVPALYRTGKTLGRGPHAIVKKAIHIKTGKYYACKILNKKFMEGKEHMMRNEISVLKRLSGGHRNIVGLHDYFETLDNLYLCLDLCTGSELFDRICTKVNYSEADAAALVRTVFTAVNHIHAAGIIHRDLNPMNILFRTPAEDADIVIVGFGLSRMMEKEEKEQITTLGGITLEYMAPEIFLHAGNSKPVDVWAMGVITYFLLAGYTPFDRDTPEAQREAIVMGDYKFEPEEYWVDVSDTARDFVKACLTIDPKGRPTAAEALEHKWLASTMPQFVPDPSSPSGGSADLPPHVNAEVESMVGSSSIHKITPTVTN